jgi:hypothetical protein
MCSNELPPLPSEERGSEKFTPNLVDQTHTIIDETLNDPTLDLNDLDAVEKALRDSTPYLEINPQDILELIHKIYWNYYNNVSF